MRNVLLIVALAVGGVGCQDRLEPLTSFEPENSTSAAHPVESYDGRLVISAHTGCIDDLVFSPSGNEIASCGDDETLRIWNSRTGEYIRGFQSSKRVLSVCYSPDGKMLAAATIDDVIHVWDTTNWEPRVIGRAKDQPQVIRFSPDSKLLAVGTSPIQLFRVSDWQLVRERAAHEQGGAALAFSGDGKLLGSGNADGFAKVWNLPQLREQASHRHDYWVGSVAFTADSAKFLTASVRRTDKTDTMEVSVLDASSGKILQTIRGEELRGHLYPNTRLAISPDDRFLVTLLDGQHDLGIVIDDEIQTEPLISVSVWELGTGRLMARQVTAKNVRALAFCPDSNSFAVADTDGGVEIWLVSKFIQEHAPDESPTNP